MTSNRYARILVVGGAAVVVAALGITTALAAVTAKTWTVRPGGAITATAGKTKLTDTTTGSTITCSSSTARGTLHGGSGLPGADAGALSAISFATCAYPANQHVGDHILRGSRWPALACELLFI